MSLWLANNGTPPPITKTTLEGALAATSHHMWDIHLYPMQLRTLLFLFAEVKLARKMVLVFGRGEGGESCHQNN